MSEPKKVALNTLGPLKKEKKNAITRKVHRFNLCLTESTRDSCPEFNYRFLVKTSVKKNGTIVSDDPFQDDDQDSDRKAIELAKRFEEKYGPKGGRKTLKKLDNYEELGKGYDESDPFIDNSYLAEDVMPDDLMTARGGFYINGGILEFERRPPERPTNNHFDSHRRKKARVMSETEDESSNSKTSDCQKIKSEDELEKSWPKKQKVDLDSGSSSRDERISGYVPNAPQKDTMAEAIESVVTAAREEADKDIANEKRVKERLQEKINNKHDVKSERTKHENKHHKTQDRKHEEKSNKVDERSNKHEGRSNKHEDRSKERSHKHEDRSKERSHKHEDKHQDRTQEKSHKNEDRTHKYEDKNHKHEDRSHKNEDRSHKHEDRSHKHDDRNHKHEDRSHKHEDRSHKHDDRSHKHEDRSHKHEDRSHKHEHKSHKHEHRSHKHDERNHKHEEKTHRHEEKTSKNEERSNRHEEKLSTYDDKVQKREEKNNKQDEKKHRIEDKNHNYRTIEEEKKQESKEESPSGSDSEADSSDSDSSSSDSNSSQEAPEPPQEEKLPPEIDTWVSQINNAAMLAKERETKTFTPSINKMFCKLESKLGTNEEYRKKVYQKLAETFKCSDIELMNKMQKMVEEKDKLKIFIDKLKEAVKRQMPSMVEKHNSLCQAAAQSRCVGSESDNEEEETGKKTPRMPRRKFEFTDELTNLLCEIALIKMTTWEGMSDPNKVSLEEYLKQYLDDEIKPIWPKNWMNCRLLFKETRLVHGDITTKRRYGLPGIKKNPNTSPVGGGGLNTSPPMGGVPASPQSVPRSPAKDKSVISSLEEKPSSIFQMELPSFLKDKQPLMSFNTMREQNAYNQMMLGGRSKLVENLPTTTTETETHPTTREKLMNMSPRERMSSALPQLMSAVRDDPIFKQEVPRTPLSPGMEAIRGSSANLSCAGDRSKYGFTKTEETDADRPKYGFMKSEESGVDRSKYNFLKPEESGVERLKYGFAKPDESGSDRSKYGSFLKAEETEVRYGSSCSGVRTNTDRGLTSPQSHAEVPLPQLNLYSEMAISGEDRVGSSVPSPSDMSIHNRGGSSVVQSPPTPSNSKPSLSPSDQLHLGGSKLGGKACSRTSPLSVAVSSPSQHLSSNVVDRYSTGGSVIHGANRGSVLTSSSSAYSNKANNSVYSSNQPYSSLNPFGSTSSQDSLDLINSSFLTNPFQSIHAGSSLPPPPGRARHSPPASSYSPYHHYSQNMSQDRRQPPMAHAKVPRPPSPFTSQVAPPPLTSQRYQQSPHPPPISSPGSVNLHQSVFDSPSMQQVNYDKYLPYQLNPSNYRGQHGSHY